MMTRPLALQIIIATGSEYTHVMQVERDAFGRDDEPRLVADLLQDPTTRPSLQLLAYEEGRPVGHVLFTRARLLESADDPSSVILAPLAVVTEYQRRGIGRALIEHGAKLLAESDVQLVFVLGDPSYYGRRGFEPSTPHGLLAPYPIVPEEAWMVRALAPGILGSVQGKIACATCMDKPEYWRE